MDRIAATSAFSITPSDTQALSHATTGGLYIGGAGSGNLTVLMQSGAGVKFIGLAAGTLLPISVSQVLATGTDVTGIVGLQA